jgi:PTS system ascorbate-specific IIA component
MAGLCRVRIAGMIGIFLITHGAYGESLIQCACHVLNRRPPQIVQLGLTAQDDPLDALPLARNLLACVDTGDGALLLTDIFGATPANLAMKLIKPGRVEGVAGVNLPMLLRALNHREKEMDVLVAKTVAGGRDGILDMSDN